VPKGGGGKERKRECEQAIVVALHVRLVVVWLTFYGWRRFDVWEITHLEGGQQGLVSSIRIRVLRARSPILTFELMSKLHEM